MSDISGIIKQTGVALEATAFGVFGAAVANQVGPKLASIFGSAKKESLRNTNTDENNQRTYVDFAPGTVPQGTLNGVWDASRYASYIAAGKGQFDPKTKFLFTVEFEFHPYVTGLAASIGADVDQFRRDLSFVIKQIDLPTYEFEYEQVNMYNFRTKVLKQINHRELNLSFYDDNANHAMNFVKTYMRLLSPISRRGDFPADSALEDHGFAWTTTLGSLNTSLRSALPGNATQILLTMKINQFYIARNISGENAEQAVKYNTFTFINPRLTSIDISDQDHEQGGTPNSIAAVFDFDSIHIDTGKSGIDYKGLKIPGADILDAAAERSAVIDRGVSNAPGGTRNPFVDIIARQGQRMVQNTVGSLLNKTFGGVAGGALQGSIYQVTGALGEATNRTLSNVGTTAAGSVSVAAANLVKDNSTSLAQSKNLSTQVSSGG